MGTHTRRSIVDLATLGIADATIDNVIAFGRTTAPTLWRLGSGRSGRPKIVISAAGTRQIRLEAFHFDIDPEERLIGIHFGFRDLDALTDEVKWAVSRRDCNGIALEAPAELDCGALRLRLFGQPLAHFATLPRLAGLVGTRPGLALTSRAYDKWLRVSLPLESAMLDLEFVLASFQEPYRETFHIDYCLYGLSLIHHSTK